jgi:hypothetical protein
MKNLSKLPKDLLSCSGLSTRRNQSTIPQSTGKPPKRRGISPVFSWVKSCTIPYVVATGLIGALSQVPPLQAPVEEHTPALACHRQKPVSIFPTQEMIDRGFFDEKTLNELITHVIVGLPHKKGTHEVTGMGSPEQIVSKLRKDSSLKISKVVDYPLYGMVHVPLDHPTKLKDLPKLLEKMSQEDGHNWSNIPALACRYAFLEADMPMHPTVAEENEMEITWQPLQTADHLTDLVHGNLVYWGTPRMLGMHNFLFQNKHLIRRPPVMAFIDSGMISAPDFPHLDGYNLDPKNTLNPASELEGHLGPHFYSAHEYSSLDDSKRSHGFIIMRSVTLPQRYFSPLGLSRSETERIDMLNDYDVMGQNHHLPNYSFREPDSTVLIQGKSYFVKDVFKVDIRGPGNSPLLQGKLKELAEQHGYNEWGFKTKSTRPDFVNEHLDQARFYYYEVGANPSTVWPQVHAITLASGGEIRVGIRGTGCFGWCQETQSIQGPSDVMVINISMGVAYTNHFALFDYSPSRWWMLRSLSTVLEERPRPVPIVASLGNDPATYSVAANLPVITVAGSVVPNRGGDIANAEDHPLELRLDERSSIPPSHTQYPITAPYTIRNFFGNSKHLDGTSISAPLVSVVVAILQSMHVNDLPIEAIYQLLNKGASERIYPGGMYHDNIPVLDGYGAIKLAAEAQGWKKPVKADCPRSETKLVLKQESGAPTSREISTFFKSQSFGKINKGPEPIQLEAEEPPGTCPSCGC